MWLMQPHTIGMPMRTASTIASSMHSPHSWVFDMRRRCPHAPRRFTFRRWWLWALDPAMRSLSGELAAPSGFKWRSKVISSFAGSSRVREAVVKMTIRKARPMRKDGLTGERGERVI